MFLNVNPFVWKNAIPLAPSFLKHEKVENLKSRQTKESLRKLNQMDFDPHDVTKEEIDEITKNPIFDENNISDFILNEYGVEKRNIILVIILRFCSNAFYLGATARSNSAITRSISPVLEQKKGIFQKLNTALSCRVLSHIFLSI